MFDLMNEVSELVYVADFETYDLLFVNTAGKKTFGIEEIHGLKCFKALHGKDEPCDFCTNHLLSTESFYTWEFTNNLVHRHYLLKDKLVEWNGRIVRLEIAFDTTLQETQKTLLKNALDADAAVLECLKTLYADENLSQALNKILRRIGTLMNSDRAYIFEIKDEKMRTTHSWRDENTVQIENASSWVNFAPVKRWCEYFAKHQCVIITDIELLRETVPEEYRFLKQRAVTRLVTMPLELDGHLTGFIGVSNPPVEKLKNVSLLLESLSYFITAYIQRHSDKQRLEILSYHDALTGILNRNAFMRDLGDLSPKPDHSIGIVYVDVNGMKDLNDLHGHPYGDRILQNTAQIITMSFSANEAYRIGGDEFAIISQNISEVQFEKQATALKNLFSNEEDFHVSIGHQWSNTCDDIQKMIFETNEIMYANKKRYYHNKVISKRYRHENDDALNLTKPGVLQDLLERGKFLIYMQPKVLVQNRRVIGAEALIRLTSPTGTLIPPDQFIPLLEETRLISMIDFYVFESICIKIEEWLAQNKKIVPVSVNFSRYSLAEKFFLQRLNEIWKRHKVPQKLIEIEITESMNLDDNDVFVEVVENIRELGFAISIDDFGVKEANLSLFTLIKFDVLKIDKVLISSLQENETSQIVLQSLSDICRKMGIHLIVEGVETEGQLRVLQEINCEGAQGYLFDRPIPITEFEEKYMAHCSLC